VLFLIAVGVLYLAVGTGFHIGWQQAQQDCKAWRRTHGEFVEPEVFPVLGIFFDVTWWPVYAAANLYHDGVVFATPCTH